MSSAKIAIDFAQTRSADRVIGSIRKFIEADLKLPSNKPKVKLAEEPKAPTSVFVLKNEKQMANPVAKPSQELPKPL